MFQSHFSKVDLTKCMSISGDFVTHVIPTEDRSEPVSGDTVEGDATNTKEDENKMEIDTVNSQNNEVEVVDSDNNVNNSQTEDNDEVQ